MNEIMSQKVVIIVPVQDSLENHDEVNVQS